MKTKVFWALACLILAVGMIFTVRDYRTWHNQEIGRFGKGSEAEAVLAPAKPLALPYTAYIASFRIKPPEGWKITENMALKNMFPTPKLSAVKLTEIVRFKDPATEAQVIISGQRDVLNSTTFSDALAVGITRDRGYLTVDNTPVTVLTWDGPKQVTQKAILVVNNVVLVIESSANTSAWKTWEKTFLAMYQTWTAL